MIKNIWPSLGDNGASRLVAWGTDGTDAKSETVGSAAAIANGLAAGVSSSLPNVVALAENVVEASGSTSASTSSETGTASAVVTAEPSVVELAAVETTESASSCK